MQSDFLNALVEYIENNEKSKFDEYIENQLVVTIYDYMRKTITNQI